MKISTIYGIHQRHKMIEIMRGQKEVGYKLVALDLDGTTLKHIAITNNGSATIHTGTNTIIHECPFFVGDLLPMIDYCRDHQIHYGIHTAFDEYVLDDVPNFTGPIHNFSSMTTTVTMAD